MTKGSVRPKAILISNLSTSMAQNDLKVQLGAQIRSHDFLWAFLLLEYTKKLTDNYEIHKITQ